MAMLRKAVALLTLIALAGNSVAASPRPCCGSLRAAAPTRSCCATAASKPSDERAPSDERRSCCASKTTDHRAARGGPVYGDMPCCCINSLPATPPAREAFGARFVLPVDQALVGDSLCLANFPSAKQRLRRDTPAPLFATAHHLCALYCIWLN